MASNFEDHASTDTDSCWNEFSDEVQNSSIEGDDKITFYKFSSEPSDVMNLNKMKKSSLSDEFEIITPASSTEELEVPINVELVSSVEQNIIARGEDERTENFLPNDKTKTSSVTYSDDQVVNVKLPPSTSEVSCKPSSSNLDENLFYHKYINLLAKNRLRRRRSNRLTCNCIFLFAVCIILSVLKYQTKDLLWSVATVTPATISTPVKTSHPGWEALKYDYQSVISYHFYNFNKSQIHNVNFELLSKAIQGISFTMTKSGMVISIGFDDCRTYNIYEKDGVIDVEMIPEKLSNNTELLFTVPKKEKVTNDFKEWHFIKVILLIPKALIENIYLMFKFEIDFVCRAWDSFWKFLNVM